MSAMGRLCCIAQEDKAFAAHMAAATEPRREAEAVLHRECGHAGLAIAYAAAICRRQFRVELADASPKQLWNLVYTIRNRAAARRRQERIAA